jgi:hypothetical protein
MKTMNKFIRYIGIDCSGAQTPATSNIGLRLYVGTFKLEPKEIQPPPSPRKYWTRKKLTHWLVETINKDIPTISGIDHGFSFPIKYFINNQLEPDWNIFI